MDTLYVGLITAVGAALLRNVAGWIENAMEDGSISSYEWGELGATIARVGLITGGLYFGFDLAPIAAAAGGIIGDFILKAMKFKYNSALK